MTILEATIKTLENLGGCAHYSELYKEYEKVVGHSITENQQAGIRACIERNSPDSKIFAGNAIFYSVEGKGKGIWGLISTETSEIQLTQEDYEFSEGKESLKYHVKRERNTRLITLAKRNFKAKHGTLFCEVCGFNFIDKYGDLGAGFIEAHHIKPVSEMSENEKTKVEDIIMVCSNCHSMIHRKRPWLNLNQIKSILK